MIIYFSFNVLSISTSQISRPISILKMQHILSSNPYYNHISEGINADILSDTTV